MSTGAKCTWVAARDLVGQRWDPPFWLAAPPLETALPLTPLGAFIEHLTYGPIVTGRRPEPVPAGVAIVDQKALRPTGVLLADAVRVMQGCAFDIPRARLRPGDIVFCRSGAGTLRKKRFTVFDGADAATVSCFVDLIRLDGIDPYYVATVLRGRFGWPQIERLINGVGTPNISFGELRALRIPLAPAAMQEAVAQRWHEIRRLHASGDLAVAKALLDEVVTELECALEAGG